MSRITKAITPVMQRVISVAKRVEKPYYIGVMALSVIIPVTGHYLGKGRVPLDEAKVIERATEYCRGKLNPAECRDIFISGARSGIQNL